MPKPSDTEATGQEAENQDAKFNFSYVECLMYAFHALGRINTEFLAAGDEATKERLRDFRLRLTYFAKGTQNYIKELRNTLSKPTNGNNKEENDEVSCLNRMKSICLSGLVNQVYLFSPFQRTRFDEWP